MMTALWILVGLQLVQTVALVVLFRFEILRHKADNKMVVRIRESRHGLKDSQGGPLNPWLLYEPGSVNHPAAKHSVDRFQTALGALEYADAIYPGVRVKIMDNYCDVIPTQDVRDGTRIKAS